jgi:hypothetical protein
VTTRDNLARWSSPDKRIVGVISLEKRRLWRTPSPNIQSLTKSVSEIQYNLGYCA